MERPFLKIAILYIVCVWVFSFVNKYLSNGKKGKPTAYALMSLSIPFAKLWFVKSKCRFNNGENSCDRIGVTLIARSIMTE